MTYAYTAQDLQREHEIAMWHEEYRDAYWRQEEARIADERQMAYHAGWMNAQTPDAPISEVDDSPYPLDWIDGFCGYFQSVIDEQRRKLRGE